MTRPLVVGNWKMHGDGSWLPRLSAIADMAAATPSLDIAICVPAPLIHRAAALRPAIAIGGQDCHAAPQGAFTGGVSAAMLYEAGARLAIVGHSERRQAGDDDMAIAAKVAAAHAAGLRVILCVGEDAAQREAGTATQVACGQLERGLAMRSAGELVVAYEPVWAIGSGQIPSAEDVAPVTAGLRATLAGLGRPDVPLLYGGSVTAGSVAALMTDDALNGFLVGQSSLDPDSFANIAVAVQQACSIR